MNNGLNTSEAADVFTQILPFAQAAFRGFNARELAASNEELSQAHSLVAENRDVGAEEAFLNDLFVLDRYIDFLGVYGLTWLRIIDGKFSVSWQSLQDALSLLRLIKKFSNVNIDFFENQLLSLEKIYPYGVFMSIGAIVKRIECSICGQDIDSFACCHRRGHLYRGEMACGIIKEIERLDHVSVVEQPEDKRCVVEYDDAGEQFRIVRFLAEQISSKHLSLSAINLVFSKRTDPNPECVNSGRNAPCFCGSGKKFKKCCFDKQFIEHGHVDIVSEQRSIERIITSVEKIDQ